MGRQTSSNSGDPRSGTGAHWNTEESVHTSSSGVANAGGARSSVPDEILSGPHQQQGDNNIMLNVTDAEREEQVSLGTLLVRVQNPVTGISRDVVALLDPGAQASYITRPLARELGLKQINKVYGTVYGFGGQVTPYESQDVEINICSARPDLYTGRRGMVVRVIDNPAGPYRAIDWSVKKLSHEHLKHLPVIPVPDGAPVDVLLGNCTASLISVRESIRPRNELKEGPIAYKTPLEWIVHGAAVKQCQIKDPYAFTLEECFMQEETPGFNTQGSAFITMDSVERSSEAAGVKMISTLRVTKRGSERLEELLDFLWKVEEPSGKNEGLSVEDHYVVEKLRSSMKFEDGRYTVACMWRPGQPEDTGDNKPLAVQRLDSLGKKFQ